MSIENERGVEYRIGWSASTNITFRGFTDWEEWDEDGDPGEVLTSKEFPASPMNMPPGLDLMFNAAGIDWWVETRESGGEAS